jgi:DNA polymerase-3 subunit beta
MKFKINQDHFSNGLSQVAGVVGNRGATPVLNNVLIEAEGDTVSFTTTNLDLHVRARVKAQISTSGSITLPVKLLSTIVSALPAKKEITVEFSGQSRVKISSGSSVFNIIGLPADGLPPFPTFSNEREFVLPAAELLGLLKKVSYAQSTDENRYVLNGVYFNFEEGKLTLVATDGRRLALAGKEVAGASEQSGNFILPAKTVGEVIKLLAREGEVKISFSERQVCFVLGITKEKTDETGLVENIHLVSKVVEGNFPNYKQVIPKEIVHRIELNRASFSDCVGRASIVATEKNGSIKVLKVIIDDNVVTLTSESSEMGEATESITVKYDGPATTIAFNPGFLKAPLDALTDDIVYLEFKDSTSPGVFKNNEDFLCVVMPQRI